MVEYKSYFEGAHRWLWFGQSWQTLPAIADHHCCSPLHCGLQYGERRLEASQEWNWNINTGVAGYFPFFLFCTVTDCIPLFKDFFLCTRGKKTKQNKNLTSVKVIFQIQTPERRLLQKRMKLRKQVTVCGGAIFCVAVFSLYLMLDRVQHDPARRQNGGNFPRVRITAVVLIYILHENIFLLLSLKHFFLNILLLTVQILIVMSQNALIALQRSCHLLPTYAEFFIRDCLLQSL